MKNALDLADYRRRVADMYATVRNGEPGYATWSQWVAQRDQMFGHHPQSAIAEEGRSGFRGLRYFDYEPGWRFASPVQPLDEDATDINHSGAGATRFRPIGTISLAEIGVETTLRLYWLEGYGGGLFLPFRDGTSGSDTYGGGRYLLDTAKGADLGQEDGLLVLDFNYAYHPSCVYSDRWSCPLAPPENRLTARIPSGERLRTV